MAVGLSIMSIFSTTFYPICTTTTPAVIKERQPAYAIKGIKSKINRILPCEVNNYGKLKKSIKRVQK
jgi:hypothetical protein